MFRRCASSRLAVIERTHSATVGSRNRNLPLPITLAKHHRVGGLTMIGILILSFSLLLAGALPWWPYSAAGRSRHHHPWGWLLDTPSGDDSCTVTTEPRIRRVDRGTPAAEASQVAAMKLLLDGNSETHLMQGDATLRKQFEEHSIARTSNRAA